jgi:hypothetical protein
MTSVTCDRCLDGVHRCRTRGCACHRCAQPVRPAPVRRKPRARRPAPPRPSDGRPGRPKEWIDPELRKRQHVALQRAVQAGDSARVDRLKVEEILNSVAYAAEVRRLERLIHG